MLKKLKAILREEMTESDSLWSSLYLIINDFKTASIKQEALERMISREYLSPVKLFNVMKDQLINIEKLGIDDILLFCLLILTINFYFYF